MNDDNILTKIVVYFAPLSLLAFGSGQTIVADIHRQVVENYGWFTDAEFLNLYALSRIAPGPGTLLVSMIGWKVGGIAGMLLATIAIFLPSSLLVYGLAHLWSHYRGAAWQRAVERGLAPVAAGMVLATCFTLLNAAEGGVLAWAVAGASALILTVTSCNPLIVLGAAAMVFLAGST